MNCEEFRATVTADPNSSSIELTAHASQCPACARYWQELQSMDRLIHRALSVNVPAQLPRGRRTSRLLDTVGEGAHGGRERLTVEPERRLPVRVHDHRGEWRGRVVERRDPARVDSLRDEPATEPRAPGVGADPACQSHLAAVPRGADGHVGGRATERRYERPGLGDVDDWLMADQVDQDVAEAERAPTPLQRCGSQDESKH